MNSMLNLDQYKNLTHRKIKFQFRKWIEKEILTKGYNFLILVPATTDDDAPINQDVVKKKEDLGGGSSPTLLDQAAVAHQDPTRFGQRTSWTAEGVLHCLDALCVLLVKGQAIHGWSESGYTHSDCRSRLQPRFNTTVQQVTKRGAFPPHYEDKHVLQEGGVSKEEERNRIQSGLAVLFQLTSS